MALLAACCFASLIGAILLRATARWIQKLEVGFGNAYFTLLLPNILNMAIALLIARIESAATRSRTAAHLVPVFMLPVGFLVQSAFISLRLRIAFRRGCLLSLAMIGLVVGLGVPVLIAVLIYERFV
jgi:hypothetical protein